MRLVRHETRKDAGVYITKEGLVVQFDKDNAKVLSVLEVKALLSLMHRPSMITRCVNYIRRLLTIPEFAWWYAMKRRR